MSFPNQTNTQSFQSTTDSIVHFDSNHHVSELENYFREYKRALNQSIILDQNYYREFEAFVNACNSMGSMSDAETDPSSDPSPSSYSALVAMGPDSSPELSFDAYPMDPNFAGPSTSTLVTTQSSPDKPCQCRICGKWYHRKAGAYGCQNQHLNIKPYLCTKKCGDPNCNKSFASKKQLSKHDRPYLQKVSACRFCQRLNLRQNILRHEDSCPERSKYMSN
ncbi:hypothetical protein CPB86DRAFT_200545 [Serendipita vermifera]|nr:hypothetical protein CPB86DRAFT_200545 [Serendipita vermifera]